MSITSVSSLPGIGIPITPVVHSAKTLGSADFMKLLAIQFQCQDPLKPMEDTAFIAQMAQFTSLEQTQTLTAEMAKLSKNQELVTANSYLGRQVFVADGSSGLVSAVQINSDGPQIVVGDKPYPISSVLYVQPGNAFPAATSPADAGGA